MISPTPTKTIPQAAVTASRTAACTDLMACDLGDVTEAFILPRLGVADLMTLTRVSHSLREHLLRGKGVALLRHQAQAALPVPPAMLNVAGHALARVVGRSLSARKSLTQGKTYGAPFRLDPSHDYGCFLALSEDGRFAAHLTYANRLIITELQTGAQREPMAHPEPIYPTSLVFSPSSNYVAWVEPSGLAVGNMRHLNLSSGCLGAIGQGDRLLFAPDESFLMGHMTQRRQGHPTNTVLYEVELQRRAQSILRVQLDMKHAKMGPGRHVTASVRSNNELLLMAYEEDTRVHLLPAAPISTDVDRRPQTMQPLAFSRDGNMLAVWQIAHPAQAFMLDTRISEGAWPIIHAAPITDMCWSPDGAVVASASEDGVLRLSRYATHAPLRADISFAPAVPQGLSFSPLGDLLHVAMADGTVHGVRFVRDQD